MDASVLFRRLETASGLAFGHATLNQPASLNALSLEMIDLLLPQLAAWAADDGIAGVILDSCSEKAFCAGGDVVDLYRSIRSTPPGQVPGRAAAFFEREYRLDHLIHCYPKPLLAWGHGIVMGGGIGLLAGASHRVVTAKTRFAMPEITIGLYPDVGGSWFLQRMPGRVGLFLALTGAPLNASDALFAGLADFALPQDDLPALLAAIVAERWQGDCQADAARLDHLLARRVTQDLPASPLREQLPRINELIGRDPLQQIAPRLTALASDPDPWLAQAGANFAKGSPTSAALAFELQHATRHASLAEVFRLEYQASVGCCLQHDFAEGVRALLVDKDRKPVWQPATLAEVTPGLIEAHLAPHFAGLHPLADLT
jgi:enoyl-CoA hydratase/carnithine racemase